MTPAANNDGLDQLAAEINARIMRAAAATVQQKRQNLEISAGHCLADARAHFEYLEDWDAWVDENIDADLLMIGRLLVSFPPDKSLTQRPLSGEEWITEPWRNEAFIRHHWATGRDTFTNYADEFGWGDAEECRVWWDWFAPYTDPMEIERVKWRVYYREVDPVAKRCKSELNDAWRRDWEARWAARRAKHAAEARERAQQRKQMQAAAAYRYDSEKSFEDNARLLAASGWEGTRPRNRSLPAGARRHIIVDRDNKAVWAIQAFSKDGTQWGLSFFPESASAYILGHTGQRYATLEAAMSDALPALCRHRDNPRSRKPTLPPANPPAVPAIAGPRL
jgi:hypothetical protein